METKELAALPEAGDMGWSSISSVSGGARQQHYSARQMHAHYLKGREDERAELAARIADLERQLKATLGTPDNDWCPECHARESGQDDVRLAALTDDQIDAIWAEVLSRDPLPRPAYRELVRAAIRALKTQQAAADEGSAS